MPTARLVWIRYRFDTESGSGGPFALLESHAMRVEAHVCAQRGFASTRAPPDNAVATVPPPVAGER